MLKNHEDYYKLGGVLYIPGHHQNLKNILNNIKPKYNLINSIVIDLEDALDSQYKEMAYANLNALVDDFFNTDKLVFIRIANADDISNLNLNKTIIKKNANGEAKGSINANGEAKGSINVNKEVIEESINMNGEAKKSIESIESIKSIESEPIIEYKNILEIVSGGIVIPKISTYQIKETFNRIESEGIKLKYVMPIIESNYEIKELEEIKYFIKEYYKELNDKILCYRIGSTDILSEYHLRV